MGEWKECRLGEVANEVTVGFVGTMANEYVQKGIPFLRSQNIKPYRIDSSDIKYISEEFNRKISKSELHPGDVVIVRTGNPGTCALIPKEIPLANCSDLVIVKSGPELNNIFFVYYMNSIAVAHVNAHLVGAVQQHFNVGSAKTMLLKLPPLPEQRAIASVLSSLDDKIDLLHRQNKTLEAMAETLFRQWFVEEAELTSEEQIFLGDLIESISITHTFPSAQVIFLNTSDIYLGDVLNHKYENVKDLPGQAKKTIMKDDIIFSEIRPANGRYAYIDFVASDYVVSTKLMVLRSKGVISQAFIYFYLTNKKTTEWLQTLAEARSGTFPQITFDQIRDLIINIPSKEFLQSVSRLCDDWLKKIKSNQSQIRTLEKLRDTLLPKLMSGEVRVEV